jgi:two-component system phosphate regulon sensor histidine kinase PhoR
MASYTFQPLTAEDEAALSVGSAGMGGDLLLHDARWFTRIRWGVVLTLLGIGGFGLVWPESMAVRFGVVLSHCCWPFVLAAVLAVLNTISLSWLRRIAGLASDAAVVANLWFQIASDLAVLTVLVYFAGLTETPVAFAFLFHIVLACIFFDRRASFLVTSLSAALFLAAVVAVEVGLLPRHSILAERNTGLAPVIVQVGFSIFVWFVVWYLTSSISDMVRRRDHELAAANTRLRQAGEDKNRQMLRVTHDLKAPFSGIESSIQVLKHVHWDLLPEGAQKIISKIEVRSATLRSRIGEILTLGRLRSGQASANADTPTALRELLLDVVDELTGLATLRDVTVSLEAEDLSVHSDPRQLKILFMNLVSNAITYSQEDGNVEVTCQEGACVTVEVRDHGIGIKPDSLPHIFEDFYRSKEAAKFNPKSTGLGLATVRQVADNLRLTIEVESEEEAGTLFRVRIPVRHHGVVLKSSG